MSGYYRQGIQCVPWFFPEFNHVLLISPFFSPVRISQNRRLPIVWPDTNVKESLATSTELAVESRIMLVFCRYVCLEISQTLIIDCVNREIDAKILVICPSSIVGHWVNEVERTLIWRSFEAVTTPCPPTRNLTHVILLVCPTNWCTMRCDWMSHTRHVLSFPPPTTRRFVTSHERIELPLPPRRVATMEPSETFQTLTVPSRLPPVAIMSVPVVVQLHEMLDMKKGGRRLAAVI